MRGMGALRERQRISWGRSTWRWMMMESSGTAAMISKTMHRKINSSTPAWVEHQSAAHRRRRERTRAESAAHLVSSCSTRRPIILARQAAPLGSCRRAAATKSSSTRPARESSVPPRSVRQTRPRRRAQHPRARRLRRSRRGAHQQLHDAECGEDCARGHHPAPRPAPPAAPCSPFPPWRFAQP